MKLCTYCTWKKTHLRSQRKQVLLLKLKIYYFHLSTIYQSGWCKAFLSYWKLQCYQNWAPHHVSPELRGKKNLSFLCISQAFGPNHFHDFYSNSKLFRPICEPVRLIHWTDSIQQVLLYPRKISMSFPGLENIILKLPGIISRNTVSLFSYLSSRVEKLHVHK